LLQRFPSAEPPLASWFLSSDSSISFALLSNSPLLIRPTNGSAAQVVRNPAHLPDGSYGREFSAFSCWGYSMSLRSHYLCGLGLRLIPLRVKVGLRILGIANRHALLAPAPINLCSSLLAFCPVTHLINAVLTLLSLALQGAVKCADIPSLLAWPIHMVLLGASVLSSTSSSLTNCPAEQLCACTLGFLLVVLLAL